MTVKMDLSEIDRLLRGPAVRSALLESGQRVAVAAAILAPKRTGAGARSIRAELVMVDGLPEARVSWDRDHYYMLWAEVGSEHQRPEPFLRPAASQFV